MRERWKGERREVRRPPIMPRGERALKSQCREFERIRSDSFQIPVAERALSLFLYSSLRPVPELLTLSPVLDFVPRRFTLFGEWA